jgi:hypothetical protein
VDAQNGLEAEMTDQANDLILDKSCPDCGETKPLSDFGQSKAREDGVASYCKDCAKDLRRLTVVGPTDEEEARHAAMVQVASLYPGLLVRGIHSIEQKDDGSWFAKVNTSERTNKNRKRTMPTHRTERGTRYAATSPDPTTGDDAAQLQDHLEEIRDLSRIVLDDADALLILIGEPETGVEAGAMLGALRKVHLGLEPLPGREAEIVQTVIEFMDEPPTLQSAESHEEEPVDHEPTAMAAQSDVSPTKRCTKCNVDKPLTAFNRDKKSKDGLSYRCRDCKNRRDREVRAVGVTDEQPDLGPLRAASDRPYRDEEQPEQPDGQMDLEPEDWRRLFANPSLDQLEALRSFLGEMTLDEVARITRTIARTG